MKKNHFIKAAEFIIRTAVALVLALGWSTADAAPAAAQGAQLQKYAEAWPEKGQFTIVRKGKAYDFDSGRGKIALAVGDVIRTHKDSKVKVILEDENTLVLGSNAVMEIKPWQSGNTRGFLKGLVGSITGWTSKDKKAPLYMQTTNATCGIRGTVFMVSLTPHFTNMSIITGDGGIRPTPIDLTKPRISEMNFNVIQPGSQGLALGNGSGNIIVSHIPPSIMNVLRGGAAGDMGGPGMGAPGPGAVSGPGATVGGPGPGGPGTAAGHGGPGAGAGPGPDAGPGAGAGPARLPVSESRVIELTLSGDIDTQLNFNMDISGGAVPQNMGLGDAPLPSFKVDKREATVVASVSNVVREPAIAPPPTGPSGMSLPDSTDKFVTDSVNVINVPDGGSTQDVINRDIPPALQPQSLPGPAPEGAAPAPGPGQTGPVIAPPDVEVPKVVVPQINVDTTNIIQNAKDKARLNIKFEK